MISTVATELSGLHFRPASSSEHWVLKLAYFLRTNIWACVAEGVCFTHMHGRTEFIYLLSCDV
jgi:hypothetical protein